MLTLCQFRGKKSISTKWVNTLTLWVMQRHSWANNQIMLPLEASLVSLKKHFWKNTSFWDLFYDIQQLRLCKIEAHIKKPKMKSESKIVFVTQHGIGLESFLPSKYTCTHDHTCAHTQNITCILFPQQQDPMLPEPSFTLHC